MYVTMHAHLEKTLDNIKLYILLSLKLKFYFTTIKSEKQV